MHKYLRAIGFSKIKLREQLKPYIREVVVTPDRTGISEEDTGEIFVQVYKQYAEDMGLVMCGVVNDQEEFELEYYYPAFFGRGISSRENVVVEQHTDKQSCAGVCEDIKVGVSLIFFLQNVCEYKNVQRMHSVRNKGISTTLSALSISGKILLPIDKTKKQIELTKEATKNRNQLIEAARKGDEDAIESLTLEDMDTYSMISRRIVHEDILSLVDNYFMPYGVECDKYSVMGEIEAYHLVKNKETGEEIYRLTINTNELIFDVCINKEDLLGEPAKGRRFKGNIWLQGRINFDY